MKKIRRHVEKKGNGGGGDTNLGNVLIKRRFSEHPLEINHITGVPIGNILIKRALVKHVIHRGNSTNIPHADIIVVI